MVSIHVLEHVAEPVAFAEKVGKALKPDGLWLNYMPNVDAAIRPDDAHGPNWIHFNPSHPAEHINLFNRDTMGRLLDQVGLELDKFGAQSDDFWTWARKSA